MTDTASVEVPRPEPRTREVLTHSARGTWGAAACAAVAGGLGALLVTQSAVVFVLVLLLAALPLVSARPVTWIGLALGVVWVSRVATASGLAPRVVDFLDFPLVLAALVFSGLSFRASGRPIDRSAKRVGQGLLLATFAITMSWAFNDFNEPQRLLAGWVMALEPFLLLFAILITPLTQREHARLLGLTLGLLILQLPFSLAELALGLRSDDVKGTLLETGAGHHVSAGGLTLAFLLLLGLRARRVVVIPFGLAALFVVVFADAKQVLFLLPITLLVFAVASREKGSLGSLVRAVCAGAVMAAIIVYVILSYQSSAYAFDFIGRSVSNDTGKLAVAPAVVRDLGQSAPSTVFGLGPGETMSRFSFLTTPALLKEGSPATTLGLHPSRGAQRYTNIAAAGPYTGTSSFTSAQSSVLGIIGDYGLAGVIAFTVLIGCIINELRRSTDRYMAAAALAAWTLLLPLAFIFDWLEQPPFTLATVAISGLCLRASPPIANDLLEDAPTITFPRAQGVNP